MSFLGREFNADELPQDESSFDPVPAGWYEATISKAELKSTKSGSGEYIAVTYDITGPTHQGRKIFGNVNLSNSNEQAERIGRQQLGELMRACGLATLKDTDQLLSKRASIKISIKPAADGYDARNEVKGWRSIAGSNMPAPSVPAPVQEQKSTPPWAK